MSATPTRDWSVHRPACLLSNVSNITVPEAIRHRRRAQRYSEPDEKVRFISPMPVERRDDLVELLAVEAGQVGNIWTTDHAHEESQDAHELAQRRELLADVGRLAGDVLPMPCPSPFTDCRLVHELEINTSSLLWRYSPNVRVRLLLSLRS